MGEQPFLHGLDAKKYFDFNTHQLFSKQAR